MINLRKQEFTWSHQRICRKVKFVSWTERKNILNTKSIKNSKLLIKLSCFGQLLASNPLPVYLFAFFSSRFYLSQLSISFFAFRSCPCLLQGRATERNEILLLYLNSLLLLLCWLYYWWKIILFLNEIINLLTG